MNTLIKKMADFVLKKTNVWDSIYYLIEDINNMEDKILKKFNATANALKILNKRIHGIEELLFRLDELSQKDQEYQDDAIVNLCERVEKLENNNIKNITKKTVKKQPKK